MKLVAHISDAHFGHHDPEIAAALLQQLNASGAALVAISGDMTQRARRAQFREARAWLDRLEVPYLVVIGNHDIPMYDLYNRFLHPRDRYVRYIAKDFEPFFEDDEIVVCGIDTTKVLTTKYGRVTRTQVRRIADQFGPRDDRWRILVAHHPLVVPKGYEQDQVDRADEALPILVEAGVDLILSGHLHIPHSAGAAGRNQEHSLIAVHAGTCISKRLRGEPNGYNELRMEGDMLTITHREWDGGRWVDSELKSYGRGDEAERLVKLEDRELRADEPATAVQ